MSIDLRIPLRPRPLRAAACLLLVGSLSCRAGREEPPGGSAAAPPSSTAAGSASVPGDAAANPGGSSDTARADTAAAAPAREEAGDPAEVIRRYYRAIDDRDYRRAYALWGDGGADSRQTYASFAAGFDRTARVEVEVGTAGRVEGAAGSRYVTIPVVVRARTVDGGAQRFTGTYTLRRAVVDGATAEQRRWHLYSAELRSGAPPS